MSEEKLWHAALQDLDTAAWLQVKGGDLGHWTLSSMKHFLRDEENLPMALRPNCPVCQRPFPSGLDFLSP